MEHKHTTVAERTELIQRFHESGLSKQDFALQNGLKYNTFARWISEGDDYPIRTKQVPLQLAEDINLHFVELKSSSIVNEHQSQIKNDNIKISKAGFTIELPSNIDINYVSNLIGVLAVL